MKFSKSVLMACLLPLLATPALAAADGLVLLPEQPQIDGAPMPNDNFPGFAIWAGSNLRVPELKALDKKVQPVQVLAVFGGLQAKSSVIEVLPTDTYWSEWVGRVTSGKGRGGYTQVADPNDKTLWNQLQEDKDYINANYQGEIKLIPINYDALNGENTTHFILMDRKIGKLMHAGNFEKFLSAAHKTLMPNGIVLVIDYRAAPGKAPDPKSDYVSEDATIAAFQKAGFKLFKKDDKIYANPKDTRTTANLDSDRFLLRFTK